VPIDRGLRQFLAIAAILALIAGILLFIGAGETDRFFSWTIEPPLTAAFMGAAYWAAFLLLAWAARQRDWAMARTAVAPVFVIALLLLAATLVHLDRFDLDSVFGWFWLIVYAAVVPLLAVLVARQVRAAGRVPPGRRPLRGWLRAILLAQAIAMLGVGVALFIAPIEAATLWPWPLTPLTGRAVGSFLCGFAVAAAFAARENDLDRLRGSAYSYAALGALELLAVALHSGDLSGTTLERWVYVGFCATVAAVGLYGVLGSASRARSATDWSR
jgi:membrane protein CcdC involved in cytochrome C biogenesis